MMLISFTYTVLLIKHPFWITGRKSRQFAALSRNDKTEYSEKALYIIIYLIFYLLLAGNSGRLTSVRQ